jgi:AcrR family transcriptional regulator
MGAVRPRNRKALIARAAEGLFHEFGYHGVGVDTVAAEVGIGGSALYRHYKGKKDLLVQVVLDGLAEFEATVAEAEAKHEHLSDALAALAAVAVDRRAVPVLWQRETRHLNAEEQAQVATRVEALEKRVESVLLAGAPADPSTRMRAQAVLSVMWSPSYHHGSLPPSDMVRLLVILASAAWEVDLPALSARDAEAAGEEGTSSMRASQRERILEVASALFAERGFAEVSVDEIGAALDISGPSVYRYFSTKVELLYTALVRAAEALHLSLSRALSSSREPAAAFEAVLASYVDIMLEHRAITQLLITEVMNLPDKERAAIRGTEREYVREWVHLVPRIHPDLKADEARIVVHAVLTVINDLLRSRRHADHATLRTCAMALGLAVLRGARAA